MPSQRLTLKDAIKSGNLEAFIAQAEADGVPAAEATQVFEAMRAIMQQPEANQTSPAPSRDGSGGK